MLTFRQNAYFLMALCVGLTGCASVRDESIQSEQTQSGTTVPCQKTPGVSYDQSEQLVLSTFSKTTQDFIRASDIGFPANKTDKQKQETLAASRMCGAIFLFGAAIGLSNWLDKTFPNEMDTNDKGLVLNAMISELNGLGWQFTDSTTAQGWPLFVGLSGEFFYVDAMKRVIRGSAPLETRIAMHIPGKFSPPTPEVLYPFPYRILDDVVEPINQFFSGTKLFAHVLSNLQPSKPNEAIAAATRCGRSPFLR